MQNVFWVGLGGMIGSIARYLVSLAMHAALGSRFPWGTLTVNLIGCAAIGAFMYAIEDRHQLPIAMRLFFVVGVLGGFTTFSAFGFETLELVRKSRLDLAAGYVAVSVIGGILAVAAGRAVAESIAR
ncbi:MAG: fluoride efflux transporter CrcB [Phycisphaerales bacterium]|nr:fluoride efflux transporter CrcB [Phycisphaerales bacterium]